MEVEGVVADSPSDCALFVGICNLIRLALDAYTMVKNLDSFFGKDKTATYKGP